MGSLVAVFALVFLALDVMLHAPGPPAPAPPPPGPPRARAHLVRLVSLDPPLPSRRPLVSRMMPADRPDRMRPPSRGGDGLPHLGRRRDRPPVSVGGPTRNGAEPPARIMRALHGASRCHRWPDASGGPWNASCWSMMCLMSGPARHDALRALEVRRR